MQTEATHETGSYDYAPFDELVCACTDIVARIVVSLCTGGDTTLPDDSVALIGVIKLIISIALYSITRWIMHQKDEKGGWVPWLGTMLRGLIVADERQCHWTGPAFDTMEGEITPRLICPITVSLVCVFLIVFFYYPYTAEGLNLDFFPSSTTLIHIRI